MTRLVRFSNNAVSKLAGGITAASTTILLTPGDGDKFPAITGKQFFMGTMVKADGSTEVVKVIARDLETLTVVRAAEPVGGVQAAYAFSVNDRFEHRLTSKALGDELDKLNSAAYVGAINKNADYTIIESDITSTIRFNTNSGNLKAYLPSIALLQEDFDIIVVKASPDGNEVQIIAAGSDIVNGASSYALINQYQGAWLVADRSTREWTIIASGSGGANPIVDVITGNGTAGPYALSGTPGPKQTTEVHVGGVYQQKSSYTISGSTITFGGVVAAGVTCEIVWAQTMQIGTPADGTVNSTKLADGAVTSAKVDWTSPPFVQEVLICSNKGSVLFNVPNGITNFTRATLGSTTKAVGKIARSGNEVVIKVAGLYTITAACSFIASGINSVIVSVAILKNGVAKSDSLGESAIGSGSYIYPVVRTTEVVYLEAEDRISVGVMHAASSDALNVSATLSCVRLFSP